MLTWLGKTLTGPAPPLDEDLQAVNDSGEENRSAPGTGPLIGDPILSGQA